MQRVDRTVKTVVVDTDRLYRDIGERLREHRKTKRWTQAKLSQLSGIDRSSIANFESGRQHPPLAILYKLSAIFDVEIFVMLPKVADITKETRSPIVKGSNRILPDSILPAIEMLRQGLDQQQDQQDIE